VRQAHDITNTNTVFRPHDPKRATVTPDVAKAVRPSGDAQKVVAATEFLKHQRFLGSKKRKIYESETVTSLPRLKKKIKSLKVKGKS